MKGCLVAADVHVHVFFRKAFPKIHHIANVSQRDGLPLCNSFFYPRDEFVQVRMEFVHPSLRIALFGSLGVDFGCDAHYSGDISRLGLRAGHPSETGGNEQHAAAVVCVGGTELAQLLSGRIHHRNGSAMHDALRTDVHITAGGHLPVLADSQGIETFPVVRFGIIRDHHSVGHYHAGCVLMTGKQPQRMSGIHYQRLIVSHRSKVLHREPVLRPVLEDGAVAAVYNQFVGMLGHSLVQIVLDHRHNSRRLP